MTGKEYEDYLRSIEKADDKGLLKKSESEKYAEFKSKDPFPEIAPSLLNSADILKYVLFTGLIGDFECGDLLGATYNCRVSGEYLYYNRCKQVCSRPANNEQDIKIGPNSITYVAVKNVFRIPDYIALRFNLRVSHVYKGLLLGTGPIIDPGFVGQIYIPLHNLTSNTYYIKPGAPLISVEFTKLSTHPSWNCETSKYSELIRKMKSADYIHKNITPNRSLYDYIDRALNEKDFYRDPGLPKSISSAVTDDMESIRLDIEEHKNLISNNLNTFQVSFEGIKSGVNSEVHEFITEVRLELEAFKVKSSSANDKIEAAVRRTESAEAFLKNFSIFAIASILVSCIAFWWNAYTYCKESDNLRNAMNAIEVQDTEYEDLNKEYYRKIAELTQRINYLENELKEPHGLNQ